MGDYREMVVSNPDVMMGKPVIKGTRITIELILEKLAAGETVDRYLTRTRGLAKKRFGRRLHLRPTPSAPMSSILLRQLCCDFPRR